MKKSLKSIFIDELSIYLKQNNLIISHKVFSNFSRYELIDNIDNLPIDISFLEEHLSKYFSDLISNKNHILHYITHNIITKYPNFLFKDFNSILFNNLRNNLSDNWHVLSCIFNSEDLLVFLENFQDKKLLSTNFCSFRSLLDNIAKEFKNHSKFESVIFNIFSLHKKLILKNNGNIIGARSWCHYHLQNTEKFEEFFHKETQPVFDTIEYKTTLIFLDIQSLQMNYILTKASGIKRYEDFLKSCISLLNNSKMKYFLNIEKAEGSFIFEKKKYQITFFSNENLNIIETQNFLNVLFNIVKDKYNIISTNSDWEDFNDYVFKNLNYLKLSDKIISKDTIIKEKKTKI